MSSNANADINVLDVYPFETTNDKKGTTFKLELPGLTPGIFDRVFESYSEKHRHFHTWDHIVSVFQMLHKSMALTFNNVDPRQELALRYAALFHDVVYDPRFKDNEERSAEYMRRCMHRILPADVLEWAVSLIKGTADVEAPDKLQKLLNNADRAVLYSTSVSELMSYGDSVWQEYSFHPYDAFLDSHFKILHSMVNPFSVYLEAYEDLMRSRSLRVGLYVGSFDPFHNGHMQVIEDASRVVDKVIVATGSNPSKTGSASSQFEIRNLGRCIALGSYECVTFEGSLADLVRHYRKNKHYVVSIIRGIRNDSDLASETNQQIFVQDDLTTDGQEVPYLFIPTRPHLQHISSTAVRTLRKLGKDVSKYVP